jgi:PAS domain S-box-containing protein
MQPKEPSDRSHDFYLTLLDKFPALIWRSEINAKCNYVNEKWLEFTGRNLEQEIRNGWTKGVHPEDLAGCLQNFLTAFDARQSFSLEYRLRHYSGEYRWIVDHGRPFNDVNGQFAGYLGACFDITESKRTESALLESKRFLRSTLDALSSHIAILDEHGTITEVNAAWNRFAIENHFSDGHGMGDNYLRVCDSAAGVYSEEARTVADGIRAIIAGQRDEFKLEYRCHSPQEKRWFIVRATRFPGDGPVRVVMAHENITERKQIEARFRRLADSDVQGVFFWNTKGEITGGNDAFLKLVRYNRGDLEAGRMNWAAMTPPEYLDLDRRALDELMATGVAAVYEKEWICKDGSRVSILIGAAVFEDKMDQGVSFVIDLTERNEADRALKNSHAQLRALSARLQSVREEEAIRIAREIHDELGQTLTGLKMDLLWTERKLGELASSAAVNALLDRVVGATEIIDGLVVTVQRIATELRPGVLDKLGLGSALQYEARRFQERTGILCDACVPETELFLSPELSTTFFRIFQECLSNVTRHAHASKVKAELKMEDEWVTMTVQDNGRGITKDELASPRSLGLTGMKERAALLGGEVIFQPGPAEGTIITARIPSSAAPSLGKEIV